MRNFKKCERGMISSLRHPSLSLYDKAPGRTKHERITITRRDYRVALIEVKELWKIYDLGEVQVEALRGANLEVEEGEF